MKRQSMLGLLILLILMFGTLIAREVNGDVRVVSTGRNDSRRAWLGVSTQGMTPQLARSMNVKTREGALVNEVLDGSPAESAGIKEEDIIVEFEGKTIIDANDLIDAVREKDPGTKISISVMRKDVKTTLQATLQKYPRSRRNSFSLVIPPEPPHIPGLSGNDISGMCLSDLNEQLGEYFETPDHRGVLVEEVERTSEANKAGFKAGDVIIMIGKETVENLRDIRHELRNYRDGDKTDIGIVRKGTKRTLNLVVDKTDDLHWFHFDRRPRGGGFKKFHFELPNHGELDSFREEMHNLRPELESLKLDVKNLGKVLRERMLNLRDKINMRTHSIGS